LRGSGAGRGVGFDGALGMVMIVDLGTYIKLYIKLA
jgi:hypothetical protein